MCRSTPGTHVALSWMPWCGHCEECLRDLPHLCRMAWHAMGHGGLFDGTPRLSRDGEPVYHYSLLSTFADRGRRRGALLRADPRRRAARRRLARRLRDHDRGRRRLEHRGCAPGRPGRRLRLRRGRAFGAPRRGRRRSRPDRRRRRRRAEARQRRSSSVRPHAVAWAGSAGGDGRARRHSRPAGVDYAVEATGRPEAMRAAFLSTRARGAAVLIGIPRDDAVVSLPALSIPRAERRVLGSIYGSSRPERDFPTILSLYRRGRLPLDRLISHRLPLERGRGRVRADEVRHGAPRRARPRHGRRPMMDARRLHRRGLGRRRLRTGATSTSSSVDAAPPTPPRRRRARLAAARATCRSWSASSWAPASGRSTIFVNKATMQTDEHCAHHLGRGPARGRARRPRRGRRRPDRRGRRGRTRRARRRLGRPEGVRRDGASSDAARKATARRDRRRRSRPLARGLAASRPRERHDVYWT